MFFLSSKVLPKRSTCHSGGFSTSSSMSQRTASPIRLGSGLDGIPGDSLGFTTAGAAAARRWTSMRRVAGRSVKSCGRLRSATAQSSLVPCAISSYGAWRNGFSLGERRGEKSKKTDQHDFISNCSRLKQSSQQAHLLWSRLRTPGLSTKLLFTATRVVTLLRQRQGAGTVQRSSQAAKPLSFTQFQCLRTLPFASLAHGPPLRR